MRSKTSSGVWCHTYRTCARPKAVQPSNNMQGGGGDGGCQANNAKRTKHLNADGINTVLAAAGTVRGWGGRRILADLVVQVRQLLKVCAELNAVQQELEEGGEARAVHGCDDPGTLLRRTSHAVGRI
mgnify:FL=1